MKYKIRYKPAFATLFITLQPGERIFAEAGAMASMDGQLSMNTGFFGGLIPGLLKSFFGGESLFLNQFANRTDSPQELVLTQSTVGDITRMELNGNELCLQPGAYIAHSAGIKVSMQWAGFASWFAGEGLFKLKLSGRGLVFFGAYGGLSEVYVKDEFIVDNGHLVAYEPGIKMNVGLSGGMVSSVTSGEGFINRLQGRGKIYLQSRSMDGLVRFLRTKLR
ncbi:tigr00266 family protein [Leptolyngbya sp. Heron Island J]|uniref:TIGR00266 family protein n=1 Tax=Leptolyngbya sp. Heron Island J TaxID=1385935 RepID=UPI0003B9808D|nr:TIGR00266 family protein [Leptolyngbya sp. Heron Island J]ESA34800.1 tigr00266 family protein [Leptolyngbya sp. Heron Island J]